MRASWNRLRRRKFFNEYLSPLRRFLRRSVGRPWDDVYSEIRSRIRADSTIQQHVLIHLWHYVERHVIEVHGCPYHAGDHRIGSPIESRGRPQFYVCPRTGLLAVASGATGRGRAPGSLFVQIGPTDRARLMEGHWYCFRMACIPPAGGWDTYLRRMVWDSDRAWLRQLYDTERYAAFKQRMSRRDVERLGLGSPGREPTGCRTSRSS